MWTVPRAVAVGAAVVVAVTAPVVGAASDRHKPVVRFTTASDSVVTSGPLPGGRVAGTATDDVSGVARVSVSYCSRGSVQPSGAWTCGSGPAVANWIHAYDATLTCRTRRACTWVAPLPPRPGRYLVAVSATDGARRVGAAPDPIFGIVA